jgi:uncharacterized protein (DUF58 family)
MAILLVLGLVVLGLMVLSPGLVRAKVRWSANKRRLFVGRMGEGRLVVGMRSVVPVYVRIERSPEGGLSLLPGGTRALVWNTWVWHETLPYSPRQRGEYAFPKVRIFAKDLLGLSEREVQVETTSESVLAYPGRFPLLSPDLRLTLLGEGPEAVGGLEDPGRFAGVREYAHGDPLNRLHWKATARQGRPMVREYARVRSSGVWVHLDGQTSGKQGEFYMEHSTALAASLLLAAEEQNLAVGLSVGRQQMGLGRGAEHLSKLLGLLALAQAQAQTHPVPVPPPGVNLILITFEASPGVIDGALRARARASRVHLIALPEGFYLLPGEKGRPIFGKTDGVLRLMRKRSLLESEGVRVHILRGNQGVLRVTAGAPTTVKT